MNIVLLKHINDIITDHNSLENPEAHTWIASCNLFGVLAFLQCILDSLLGGVCLGFTLQFLLIAFHAPVTYPELFSYCRISNHTKT